MAIKTPRLTTTEPRPALDAGPDRSDASWSRAVRPKVVVPHQHMADKGFGEAFLAWRCGDCGAMGDLESFPSYCPDCEAPREHLYYWTED